MELSYANLILHILNIGTAEISIWQGVDTTADHAASD